ncbi:surface protein 1 [Poronia punctata]|nr:surface protein 1 [Poronia punctata]
MQFTTTTLTALLAVCAPVLAKTRSTFASAEWTLTSLARTCNTNDTTCTWTFGIDTNTEGVDPTDCVFVVRNTGVQPASTAPGGPVTCGAYTITSGWSGQFGAGNGFTVLSVVDRPKNLIVYAGYRDDVLGNGTVVDPDLSFPVQTLQ